MRMEQGQAYFLQGRYAESAAEFEAAYSIFPFAAFLYNAGVSYEAAGNLSRALTLFERYLEAESNPHERRAAEKRIGELREKIRQREAAQAEAERAKLEQGTASGGGQAQPASQETPSGEAEAPSPPSPEQVNQLLALIAVETEPDGATVTISRDGEIVMSAASPFTQTLSPGTYRISIQHPAYNRFERDFEVRPGVLNRIFSNLSQGEFWGYLRVISDPPGAQVFIDDREIGPRGQTPYEGPVQVGQHKVWVEKPGFQGVEREVGVGVAEEIRLDFQLERSASGKLRVIANLRGGRVFVDGHMVGTIPWEGELPAGPHKVKVEHEGMKAWSQTVDVPRGQLLPIRVRFNPEPGKEGAVVAGVIGALFLGGGIAATVYVNDTYGSLSYLRERGVLSSNDDRLDIGFWVSIGQYAGYGLAGICAALAIANALQDSGPPSEGTLLEVREWSIVPKVLPGTMGEGAFGLAWSGRMR
ncbi:MAG: PEGA domain-containing protein [Sandaracinaceae bacterium]|nr:PEGA domain-containing protein [Sandaracinaceae bacterium]